MVALVVGCSSTSGSPTDSTVAPPVTTTPTVPAETTTTTLLPGTEDLPEEVRIDLMELVEVTETVRELEFLEPPMVTVVTEAELAERVRDDLEENLEDVPADEALYDLLGLIEPDTDLADLYLDLYSEQVAGFYDGETRELVVPVTDTGFNITQRATLVHELTHALSDQHYNFHDLYASLLDDERYDEASAYQAVIEGDAVLTELFYLQTLGDDDRNAYIEESLGLDSPAFENAPQFIQDSLIFPYDTGFAFVLGLHQAGSFEAIAAAYADPPTSTEQIIDPNDYPADGPITVTLPEIEVDGYPVEYGSTWGELGFVLMFDQVLGPGSSATASGGWGGDSYKILFDGTDAGLVLQYRGDTAADAVEMAAALEEYVGVALEVGDGFDLADGRGFAGEDFAWVRVEGADVMFVAGSSEVVFDGALEDALVLFDDAPDG